MVWHLFRNDYPLVYTEIPVLENLNGNIFPHELFQVKGFLLIHSKLRFCWPSASNLEDGNKAFIPEKRMFTNVDLVMKFLTLVPNIIDVFQNDKKI